MISRTFFWVILLALSILAVGFFSVLVFSGFFTSERPPFLILYLALVYFFLFSPGFLAPIFLSSRYLFNKRSDLPFGFNYLQSVNSAMFWAGLGLVLSCLFVPLFAARMDPSYIEGDFQKITGIPPYLYSLGFLPLALLTYVNRGLLKRRRNARILQMIISIAFLGFFPVGTLLYFPAVFLLFFNRPLREHFTKVC